MTQALEAMHGKLWRYCAFDLDRLRQRRGAHWQPFERYNVERAARDPAASPMFPV